MADSNLNFPFYSILKVFSAAIDLISKKVVGHHKQVAYITFEIGKEMGFSSEKLGELFIAALLHDVGVFYLNQNFDDLSFDNKDNQHAEVGYQLVKEYFNSNYIPEIIRYHHLEWNQIDTAMFRGKIIPEESQILFLADRITTLIRDNSFILNQVPEIEDRITKLAGRWFWPEAVNSFLKISAYESFWLNAVNNLQLERELNYNSGIVNIPVDLDNFMDFGCFSSHIIDFRSPFTATHSSGVAVIAEQMAGFCGFSNEECQLMKLAGYLHDIGKLAVPLTILDKPGKLNRDEWAIMKSHSYYTHQVLSEFEGFQMIRDWSSFHHEHLNGRGYPFHLTGQNLSRGARLMAVADVFTAITEDRPYRKRMKKKQVVEVLEKMQAKEKLDSTLIEVLLDNYDILNEIRLSTQAETSSYFRDFKKRNTLNF